MITDDYVILPHFHKLSYCSHCCSFSWGTLAVCPSQTTSNLSSSPTLPTPLPPSLSFQYHLWNFFVYYIIYLFFMSIGSNVNFIKMGIFIFGSWWRCMRVTLVSCLPTQYPFCSPWIQLNNFNFKVLLLRKNTFYTATDVIDSDSSVGSG